MKSVAMFNNKGGVGKTTLLCNLAAYLTIKMGKKVLVVDCDPQCNTTQLIMGEEFASAFYWDSHSETATTIFDLLQPIQEGDSATSKIYRRHWQTWLTASSCTDHKIRIPSENLSSMQTSPKAGHTCYYFHELFRVSH